MIPAEWTEHRREDSELLGWIRPEGALWLAVDVLGREASGALEWPIPQRLRTPRLGDPDGFTIG